MSVGRSRAGTTTKPNTFGTLLERLVEDGQLDPGAKSAAAIDLTHEVLSVGGGGCAPALTQFLQNLEAPVFHGLRLTTTLPRPSLDDMPGRGFEEGWLPTDG